MTTMPTPSPRAVSRAGQFAFRFPPAGPDLNQDQEWCEVCVRRKWQRFRFHDYESIYRVPGLYEALFYRRLKCCSPFRVVSLLQEVLSDPDVPTEPLTVLDIGAGNGMVGQELRRIGASVVVGVDILEAAREATNRDRPGVYDDYLVADLTALPAPDAARLRERGFNTLTTVAALGFGDIPPQAFITAYNLIQTPGNLAFNIKEDFLDDDADHSGFSRLIHDLTRKGLIQIQAYRRYRHRLSVTGEPLDYVAIMATKQEPIPESWPR
jgi:predicted TPR repeat methyltransferase